MIIICPQCQTRYDLPDGAIGAAGRTVRCANCRESWFEPGVASGMESAEPAYADGMAPDLADANTAAPASQILQDVMPEQPALSEPAVRPVFSRLPLVAPAGAPDPVTPRGTSSTAPTYPIFVESPLEGADQSRQDHPLPMQPRRRWTRWLLMLLALTVLVGLLAAALTVYGTPGWIPVDRPTFAKAKPGLVLNFPRSGFERKTLADGTEFFGASGTITNTAAVRQSVPPVLIVLRDGQNREVYRWEVVPPKHQLAAGETMHVTEAVTDIPKSAIAPEIGWMSG